VSKKWSIVPTTQCLKKDKMTPEKVTKW
jgi:hypothetical protein